MAKYVIWNKKDPILTPIGEVLSAEKWIERYPIAGLDTIKVVCAGGEINGEFFGTLGQMVGMYTKMGCDFSACETDQDTLDVIEAFEDEKNARAAEEARAAAERELEVAELNATSMASIAAQLEYQNMITLEDVEV